MSGLTHEECLNLLTLDGNSTATVVKASGGVVLGWSVHNTSAAPVYVKLYNIAAGSVLPASSVPRLVVGVPAGAVNNLTLPNGIAFPAAISVRVVTDIGHTGTTAPSAATVVTNILFE
jgi:hypothetical protein